MTSDVLKIVSLNTEQDRHFERIIPFLKEHKPDVVLLQEVLNTDISFFEENLNMKSLFSPSNYLVRKDRLPQIGLVTLSALPMTNYSAYYRGREDELPVIIEGDAEKMARSIVVTHVTKNNTSFCLVNVYFTWSPDGKPTEMQYRDQKALLKLLSPLPEFILCGDFNAPRGTLIFDGFAARYKDNIPPHITTTIDKNLHRAGDLNIVVDGVFTTPAYHVTSIELFDGLSDHWGVVAEVVLQNA